MKYPVSFVCDLSVIDFVRLGYRQELDLVEKTVLSVDCQYWSRSQPLNWTLRPRYATLTKRLVDFQLKLGFPPSCWMARRRGTHEYDRGHRAGPVKFNMSEQPLLACMSRKKQYHQKNNEFRLTDFSNPSITNHSIGKTPHNSVIFAGHFGSKALGVKKNRFSPCEWDWVVPGRGEGLLDSAGAYRAVMPCHGRHRSFEVCTMSMRKDVNPNCEISF